MSPIRVGIIGLSARAKTSWASDAHLPYLQASISKYVITALCNSSISAAQAAIEAYRLDAGTKAYGNPEDLANDTDVDLVCCNTRVDVHYEVIKPSLLKGKDVYCEWPLAANLKAASELNTIAKQKGSRTMIGLQGQVTPIILMLKSLIEEGDRIGKVLSSSIVASGGTKSRDSVIEDLQYFTQKEIGGNFVTIGFGHMIDFVQCVLGELAYFDSQLSIQRPQVGVRAANGDVIRSVSTDVADHIMLQGALRSGAPLSVIFRQGPPFKDDPGLTWLIHGEKGEIKLTSAAAAMQASNHERQIAIHDFGRDDVEVIQWDQPFQELPGSAQNVAALYEAFAEGDVKRYPDFDHAVLRHTQIDKVFKSSEEKAKGN